MKNLSLLQSLNDDVNTAKTVAELSEVVTKEVFTGDIKKDRKYAAKMGYIFNDKLYSELEKLYK